MKYFDFKRENLNSNTKENRNGRLKVFDINLTSTEPILYENNLKSNSKTSPGKHYNFC